MLKGKTAIVTGSTSGIGLGLAEALAGAGCNIMLNGFGEAEAIESIRIALERDAGVRVGFHGADMRQAEQIHDLVNSAVRDFGGVDILVNNAGVQHTDPVEEFPADHWDAIIATNLSAAFHGIQAALPHMRKAGWGRIINTASVHGLAASIHKSAYVSAKHGLIGLTKVVGLETATEPITCNAICPGWVRTDLTEKQITVRAGVKGLSVEEAAIDMVAEKQPSKTFVTPGALGALAVFLCGEAAEQITGAALNMDGGWLAQ